ncbi:MAG TPA: hypothetical protein VFA56_10215 [Gaiellaceae bacterium]|nr:hypothetical protein [Gaiellaceae bacterium]
MSKILALGGGALVGIACFLPLLSLSVTFGQFSSSGNLHATDLTAGKLALVFAIGSLLLAVWDVRGGDGTLRRPAAACAIVGAAIVVYKSWTLTSKLDAAGAGFAHASMGLAMWVALVGAAVALASDFVSD